MTTLAMKYLGALGLVAALALDRRDVLVRAAARSGLHPSVRHLGRADGALLLTPSTPSNAKSPVQAGLFSFSTATAAFHLTSQRCA